MRKYMYLVIFLPALAFADQSSFKQIVQNRQACLGSVQGMSEAGAEDCELTASQALDKELNADFQAALKTMDAPTASAYRAADQAWLNYRTAQVDYVGQLFSMGPGAGHAMATAANEITIDRVRQILQY